MNAETLLLPPQPVIDRIRAARLDSDGRTLACDSKSRDAGFHEPPVAADSDIRLQAGDARFFSTLLVNANLQVFGESDAPPDFQLHHYRARTAAGTIRSGRDGALIVRVPNTFDENDALPDQSDGLTARAAGGGDG